MNAKAVALRVVKRIKALLKARPSAKKRPGTVHVSLNELALILVQELEKER